MMKLLRALDRKLYNLLTPRLWREAKSELIEARHDLELIAQALAQLAQRGKE